MPGTGSQACPKPLPLAEEREQKRLLRLALRLGKLALRTRERLQGPTAKRRATKAAAIRRQERAIKSEAKRLDGRRCRFPNCEMYRFGKFGILDASHVQAEGMGGDPQLRRCRLDNLIALCRVHHRAHGDGWLRMELGPDGTRGPVDFYVRERGKGRWWYCGESAPPLQEQL